MRLGKFALTAVIISVVAGLVAFATGTGAGRAALLALALLVILQIGYFLFLVAKAARLKHDRKD